MDKIRIKSIQDNLEKLEKETKRKTIYSLDFKGELWLIITKDDIYVKMWNPTCPSIPELKLWNEDIEDNFDDCVYKHFEDYDDEELEDIVCAMIKECNYSERKFKE